LACKLDGVVLDFRNSEEEGIMVTVTAKAKEKLKELLQGRTTDPQEAMRIISSPLNPE